MVVSFMSLRTGDILAHVFGSEAPVPSTSIVYFPSSGSFYLVGDVATFVNSYGGGGEAVCHFFTIKLSCCSLGIL